MSEKNPARQRLETPVGSRFRFDWDSDAFAQGSERVARFLGTGRYLAIQTVIVIVWILLNVFAVALRWDPYPFILLNLAFSTQAAYAAPLILQFFPRHLLMDAYEIAVTDYPQTRALHMAILEGIEKLTFGSALFAAAASTAGVPAMPEVSPEDYPNLAQSVAASQFDDEGNFVEALRMFLAGVRVRTQAS